MSLMQVVFDKKGYVGLLKLDDCLQTLVNVLRALAVLSLLCLVCSPLGWIPAAVVGMSSVCIGEGRLHMWRKLDLRMPGTLQGMVY